jgi:hypothetical protein
VQIVPDCDHFYSGREDAVLEIVASWLARTLFDGSGHARAPSA